MPVPQLTAPGTVEERLLLPSFLYLASEQEFPPGSLALPWDKDARDIVGEFARAHGVKVPTRLVSSAKSWLSHAGVDRTSALLPWQAPPDVQRDLARRRFGAILRHLVQAWNARLTGKSAEAELNWSRQQVILTVPASFDAAARDLTMQAAAQAGLQNVTLLEEPQAALYAWLESMGESFRKHVQSG